MNSFHAFSLRKLIHKFRLSMGMFGFAFSLIFSREMRVGEISVPNTMCFRRFSPTHKPKKQKK
jgi:hypothetical protein